MKNAGLMNCHKTTFIMPLATLNSPSDRTLVNGAPRFAGLDSANKQGSNTIVTAN